MGGDQLTCAASTSTLPYRNYKSHVCYAQSGVVVVSVYAIKFLNTSSNPRSALFYKISYTAEILNRSIKLYPAIRIILYRSIIVVGPVTINADTVHTNYSTGLGTGNRRVKECDV